MRLYDVRDVGVHFTVGHHAKKKIGPLTGGGDWLNTIHIFKIVVLVKLAAGHGSAAYRDEQVHPAQL